MSIIGNVLWLVFGGLLVFVEYVVAGLLLCATIIGIPFGLQCFKLAVLALMPFGKEVADVPGANGCLSTVMNVLWIPFFGVPIALTHIAAAALCAITIIGVPFAVQHVKLARLALTPFGHKVRGG